MVKKIDTHGVTPDAACSFLRGVLPFNALDDGTLEDLARHCRVAFFPKGTLLFRAAETEITHLHLIQSGGVKAFIEDEQGEVVLKDFRGEGAYIGALSIIRGTPATLNIETVEDTFCLLLPRDIFLGLVEKRPTFANFYLLSFSDKLVKTAYNELRYQKLPRRAGEDLYLFSVKAGDLVKTLQKVSASCSVREAAATMETYRVGSVLVHAPDDSEDIVGIVTDRDLRGKVVAAGLDLQRPVLDIMSGPVETVLSQALCFDVLLKMMATSIHHLAVERRGRIIGVITSHDIMLLQGHSPYYLFKEIRVQQGIEGLYVLARKIPDVIRGLIKEGAKAGNITQMIAILNDHILERLLTLLEDELGPAPLPYCWLLMGSEGRREQTFKTDQDNAIVYADPQDTAQGLAAASYFEEFAKRAIGHLVRCGYPLCPGEIMATTAKWCQPLAVWKGYFASWIGEPDPQELLHATIFFDFRCGFGEASLARELRHSLKEEAGRQELFLYHLARQCMASRVPLSFFKNFIVDKDGAHKDTLNIKHQGLTPFVNFARVLSLGHGISETNTLSRLQALYDAEVLTPELWKMATEAYELQMQQRLLHQLSQIEEGQEPDNHIHPNQLSDLEKRMLKAAFTVIERLYGVLESMYPQV